MVRIIDDLGHVSLLKNYENQWDIYTNSLLYLFVLLSNSFLSIMLFIEM